MIDTSPEKDSPRCFGRWTGAEHRFTLLVNKLDPADPESRYLNWQSLRLFRLRPDVRWTYRIHEPIQPALYRAGIPLCDTNIQVRHTGYEDHALLWSKLDRNDRLVSLRAGRTTPRSLPAGAGGRCRAEKQGPSPGGAVCR